MRVQLARYPAFAMMLMLASACSTLGLEKAKSFDDNYIYAYKTYSALINTTADAVDAGLLSKADGKEVRKRGTDARKLIDEARDVANAGDLSTGQGKITAALKILTDAQKYFDERKH